MNLPYIKSDHFWTTFPYLSC